MTERQRLLFFALAVVAVGTAFAVLGLRKSAKTGVLSAVPAESYLVATVEVKSLRDSPVLKPLEDQFGDLLALGSLRSTCGFDPVERVSEFALALPEEQSKDLGVAAAGDFSQKELIGCAEKVVAARGGAVTKTTRGDFVVLEDATPGGTKALAKLAVKDGLALVARGAWLDAMIEATHGAPSVADNPKHAALRKLLQSRLPSGAPETLLMTVLLPKDLRDRLKTQMVDEVPGGNAAMAGVLGVESAGVAISLGPEETQLAVEMHCETEAGCDEVRTLLLEQRKDLLGNFKLVFTGLRPLVDSIHLDVAGASLSGSAHGPTQGVGRGVELLMLQLEQPHEPRERHERHEKEAPLRPAPAPDPTLGPQKDAGPPPDR